MKDLDKCSDPLSFEVRESCGIGDYFVNHIPYDKHFKIFNTEEYLNDAIKELVLRYATSNNIEDVLLQFTDRGIPGAAKIIIDSIKNAFNIIAAILYKFDISNYFISQRDPYKFEEGYIDIVNIIHMDIVEKSEKNINLCVNIEYAKMSEIKNQNVIEPIVIKCDIPLSDDYDNIRHKQIAISGDTTYTVLFDTTRGIENETILKDVVSVSNIAVDKYDEIIRFIYNILYINETNHCKTCVNNKFESTDCCLKSEIDLKDIVNYMHDKYLFIYNDDKTVFNLSICEKDIGGFARFNFISRRMIEHSLMVGDYIDFLARGGKD